MNKSLLYVGGAVLGIGAAVAVFSVMGGGDESPEPGAQTEQVAAGDPAGPRGEKVKIAEGVSYDPNLDRRTPPPEAGTGDQPMRADQQAVADLLQRPVAQLISGTDSSLRHVSLQVRAAGDDELADDIVSYIDEVRPYKRQADIDEAALVARLKGLIERAEKVSGLSADGQRSLGVVKDKLAQYEG